MEAETSNVLGEITKACKKLLEKPEYSESITSEEEIEEEIRKLQDRLPIGATTLRDCYYANIFRTLVDGFNSLNAEIVTVLAGFAEVVRKSELARDFSIMSTFLEALHALTGESHGTPSVPLPLFTHRFFNFGFFWIHS
jgi:hypothetical protein